MSCVLIVQYSSAFDGSAYSGLLLANGLREAGWNTHVAFGYDGPIIDLYSISGHTTYVVPHKNWLRRSRTLQFIKDVIFEIRNSRSFLPIVNRIRPDIIYINTAVSFSGAVTAWRYKIPIVWHLREMLANVGGELTAPSWLVPLVRKLFRIGATKLLANSLPTATNLLGKDVRNHVSIIPNAVKDEFYKENRSCNEARKVFNLPLNIVVIGVPGTFRPMKGHEFFLESIEPVLEEHKDLHIAITGGGENRFARHIRQLANSVSCADRIHLVGWVQDMPAFYRACDFVCIPSSSEPFGRTAIEAFATGTPVIATAVGGLQDIVVNGETGLLVPYGNKTALTKAISQFLNAPEFLEKLSNNARQIALNKYHERVYKRRIVQLLNHISDNP